MATTRTSSILNTFALGRQPWKTFDPFLFCMHHVDEYPAGLDNLGPDQKTFNQREIGSDFSYIDGWSMYHGDTVPGFPEHPHRGFETITVTRRGNIDHFDSLGAAGRYGNGDTQWMTAGSGIQHSEMFPLVHRDKPNHAELFQIWINLPKKSKFVKPHFTMFWAEDTPKRQVKDANGIESTLTVVAGKYADVAPLAPPPDSWASQEGADCAVWTIEMPKGATFVLPATKASTNRAIYVVKGSLTIDGATVLAGRHGAKIDASAAMTLRADEETDVLMLQGTPIGEPVAQHGPFVMNTQEEIAQAFSDFRKTQFGGWPWPSGDTTHPREAPRHAKYPDGHLEYPPQKN